MSKVSKVIESIIGNRDTDDLRDTFDDLSDQDKVRMLLDSSVYDNTRIKLSSVTNPNYYKFILYEIHPFSKANYWTAMSKDGTSWDIFERISDNSHRLIREDIDYSTAEQLVHDNIEKISKENSDESD